MGPDTSTNPTLSLKGRTILIHSTLDHLRALKLDGMVDAFGELQTQDGTASLSHAEWLGLLVDREITNRANKRF